MTEPVLGSLTLQLTRSGLKGSALVLTNEWGINGGQIKQ